MRRTPLLAAGGLGVLSLVVVVAAGAFLPSWAQGRLAALKATVEDEQGVDVAYDDLEVTWWSSFPQITATLHDVAVVNRAPFAGVELFRTAELTVQLELGALLADELTVQKVVVRDASMPLVARNDDANWVLGDDDASTGATTPVDLQQVTIDGLDLRYDSEPEGVYATLEGLQLRTSGTVTAASVRFASELTVERFGAGSGDRAWLTPVPVTLTLPLDLDRATGGLTLGKVRGNVADLPVALKGHAVPAGGGWDLDLGLATPGAELASLLSLLPHTDADALSRVDARGTLALSGTVKGRYDAATYPGADIDLTLTDGHIDAAGGPGPLTQLDVDLHVARADGPAEATTLTLRQAAWTHLGQPMRLSATLSPPLSNPSIDAEATGRVNLGALDRTLPTDIGWTGVVALDGRIATRGHTVRRARGTLDAQDLASDDLELPVVAVALDKGVVTVRRLDVRQGRRAASVSGTLRDALGYALGDGSLGGELVVRATTLDLRSDDEPGDERDGVATVPTDLALGITLDLERVLYDDYVLAGVGGHMALAEGAVHLQGLGFDAFGGSVTIDGTYRAPTADEAHVDGTMAFRELRVEEVMKTVDTAAEIVPIAARAGGRMGGSMTLDTRLATDGGPDLPSLFSEGLVLTVGSTVKPEVLQAAAAKLRIPALASVDLSRSSFDYRIEEGRLHLTPTKVQLGRTPATLGGTAGIVDKTLDLFVDLTLPTSELKNAQLDTLLPAGVPDIDVRIGVVGPYDKPRPKVSTSGLDEVADDVIDRGKEAASDVLDEASARGDELIAAAEKAAAALIVQAQAALDGLVAEAEKQGDRLVAQANNPIAEGAAKLARDELVKQARKQGRKLVKEAEKKGDELIGDARAQKAQLEADARKKLK